MDKNKEERPMVSVGLIINGLVEQGFDRDCIQVVNNCLVLITGVDSIEIAEIYQGEIDLNDICQWFNLNK